MSADPQDDILGAVRKKGAFFFNPYARPQQKYYASLKALEEAGAISVDRGEKKRWVCSAGPLWTRRFRLTG